MTNWEQRRERWSKFIENKAMLGDWSYDYALPNLKCGYWSHSLHPDVKIICGEGWDGGRSVQVEKEELWTWKFDTIEEAKKFVETEGWSHV